ncbi:MAG: hypothetical protein QXR71_03095 [Candidatus Aenigmatarchaeota archaeon]
MHDIAKLFIAKKFRIKVLRILSKRKDLPKLLEEFKDLILELEIAKKERIKAQYYTGTAYLENVYRKRAKHFFKNIVEKFLIKNDSKFIRSKCSQSFDNFFFSSWSKI